MAWPSVLCALLVFFSCRSMSQKVDNLLRGSLTWRREGLLKKGSTTGALHFGWFCARVPTFSGTVGAPQQASPSLFECQMPSSFRGCPCGMAGNGAAPVLTLGPRGTAWAPSDQGFSLMSPANLFSTQRTSRLPNFPGASPRNREQRETKPWWWNFQLRKTLLCKHELVAYSLQLFCTTFLFSTNVVCGPSGLPMSCPRARECHVQAKVPKGLFVPGLERNEKGTKKLTEAPHRRLFGRGRFVMMFGARVPCHSLG